MSGLCVLLHSAAAGVLLQDTGQVLPAALPTFFDIISNDEDTTLRSIVQITNGVTSIVDKVQTLLTYWEKKYKHMWDQDKEAYIRQVALSTSRSCIEVSMSDCGPSASVSRAVSTTCICAKA